jgi:hypothetical protein
VQYESVIRLALFADFIQLILVFQTNSLIVAGLSPITLLQKLDSDETKKCLRLPSRQYRLA